MQLEREEKTRLEDEGEMVGIYQAYFLLNKQKQAEAGFVADVSWKEEQIRLVSAFNVFKDSLFGPEKGEADLKAWRVQRGLPFSEHVENMLFNREKARKMLDDQGAFFLNQLTFCVADMQTRAGSYLSLGGDEPHAELAGNLKNSVMNVVGNIKALKRTFMAKPWMEAADALYFETLIKRLEDGQPYLDDAERATLMRMCEALEGNIKRTALGE